MLQHSAARASATHATSAKILGRRAVLSLAGLSALAEPAYAGFFDSDGPRNALSELARVQFRMGELAQKLSSGELKGSNEEDAIVVLRSVAIYGFKGTAAQMTSTVSAMPLVEAPGELERLASRFDEQVELLQKASRARDADGQKDAAERASGALAEYLKIAGGKYQFEVPAPPADMDQSTFIKTYYGIFSCEGMGLERVAGSNTCKQPVASEQNRRSDGAQRFGGLF